MLKKAVLFLQFSLWAMAGTVSLRPLEFPGVQVSRATAPSVQPFITSVLGGMGSERELVRSLLPYSVVLENSTSHAITAYTLLLTFVDANGKSGRDIRQYFNFESESNGMEIPAGTQHLVTPLWAFGLHTILHLRVGPSQREAEVLTTRLSFQTAVAISVDLVVFDNGQVIGADDANTLSYLKGYLNGEHEAASLVVDAINKGDSPEQVATRLQRLVDALRQQNTYEAYARASQASRFLRFAKNSPEGLYDKAQRVLGRIPVTLYR